MILISNQPMHIAFVLVVILSAQKHIVRGERGSLEGCYTENLYLYKSQVVAATVDECVDACERLYFRFAAVSNDICLCANKAPEHELNEEQCTLPCKGDRQQVCGGFGTQSFYYTGVEVAGPPSNIAAVNSTDTSLTIRWQHPDSPTKTSLNVYRIRAVVVQTYATNQIPQPREWIVPKGSNGNFELVNLMPATKYNVSITSRSDEYGDGGTNSIIAETMIGTPDPEPDQPHVISRNGQQMEVEIPNPVNYNGPISQIHVVVVFVDSELSQSFDEKLLNNYNQAQEDGTSYYIAAELNYENRTRRFTVGDGKYYNGYFNAPLPNDRHTHVSLGILSRAGPVVKRRYAIVTTHEQHVDDHDHDHDDDHHNDLEQVMAVRPEDDNDDSLVGFLITACMIFGILLILTVVAYTYLRIRTEQRLRRMPSDHHELTLQGPIMEYENNGGFQRDHYNKATFDQKLTELLNQLDGAKRHPRNALTLNINDVIGTGNFGDVIHGNLNKQPSHVHVISDDMEPLDQMQFLNELAQIQKIGAHNSILAFYGVCQTADWLYLLFEDIPQTLKERLLEARLPPNVDAQRFSSMTERTILQILCDVANAMEYLSMYEFVHKKLCAYNVRITSDDQVKLSCFGATPFDPHGKRVDLTRWSAPEVQRFQHYSDRGDIWSFGCLMWETCCLGATPFASIAAGDLAGRIKSGARLERVPFVYDDMTHLFAITLEMDPSERPSFADISHSLRQLLTSPMHVLSFDRQEGVTLPYYLPLMEMQTV